MQPLKSLNKVDRHRQTDATERISTPHSRVVITSIAVPVFRHVKNWQLRHCLCWPSGVAKGGGGRGRPPPPKGLIRNFLDLFLHRAVILIDAGMCKTFLFLAVFVVPLLSRASFWSSLLALGGMLADSSDNIWCLSCHPGCLCCGRQQQLYLDGVRQF